MAPCSSACVRRAYLDDQRRSGRSGTCRGYRVIALASLNLSHPRSALVCVAMCVCLSYHPIPLPPSTPKPTSPKQTHPDIPTTDHRQRADRKSSQPANRPDRRRAVAAACSSGQQSSCCCQALPRPPPSCGHGAVRRVPGPAQALWGDGHSVRGACGSGGVGIDRSIDGSIVPSSACGRLPSSPLTNPPPSTNGMNTHKQIGGPGPASASVGHPVRGRRRRPGAAA